eukprot:1053364-Prorocentrum_minimum.AAC.3
MSADVCDNCLQVCAVVDAAELCRNTHPDPDYIAAADQAYLDLTTYLAVRASCFPSSDPLIHHPNPKP